MILLSLRRLVKHEIFSPKTFFRGFVALHGKITINQISFALRSLVHQLLTNYKQHKNRLSWIDTTIPRSLMILVTLPLNDCNIYCKCLIVVINIFTTFKYHCASRPSYGRKLTFASQLQPQNFSI